MTRQFTWAGVKISLSVDVSTIGARTQWNNMFKVLRKNNWQTLIINSGKLFQEGDIKAFSNKDEMHTKDVVKG